MRFYNQVLQRSLEITQSKPVDLRVLVSEKYEYPSLGIDEYGKVMRIPKPVKQKEGYALDGLIFQNDEIGRTLLMRTVMASIEHLSVHAVISDFSLYNNWLRNKDPRTGVFVIDLIEDQCVKLYAKSKLKGLLQNMALANAVSYVALTPRERINSTQYLIQSALLSYFIAGRYRFMLPTTIKKDVLTILASLHNFEKNILNRKDHHGSWWLDKDVKDVKLKLADAIASRLEKYGTPKEMAFLPYTDAHAQVERVNEELTLELMRSIDIFSDTFRNLGLQLTSDKSVQAVLGKSLREEASNMLYDMATEENWKRRVLENYSKLAQKTGFDSLTFPEEDFTEYSRKHAIFSGAIRKVTEQVKLVVNDIDGQSGQEAGEIDMQEAIQAVASQKPARNIFIRDDFLIKNEAWAILLDISGSLKPFSMSAKEMALCLAELANQLVPDQQSWGMYGFSNRFVVLKDMNEDFSTNVKARIGGLVQGGLSYIPDALQMASSILNTAGKDHNFLFVISDGLPSGYVNIEAKSEQMVKDVRRKGNTIISIGIGSKGLGRFMKGATIKANGAYDLMRKFAKLYFELSAA